jgi:hypothetical protein
MNPQPGGYARQGWEEFPSSTMLYQVITEIG